MKPKHTLQSVSAPPQEPQGDLHVAERPRELDAFPRVMHAIDMAEFFRCEIKTFYRKAAAGDYDFALIKPVVGRLEFDRERVRQHISGERHGLTGVARRKRA